VYQPSHDPVKTRGSAAAMYAVGLSKTSFQDRIRERQRKNREYAEQFRPDPTVIGGDTEHYQRVRQLLEKGMVKHYSQGGNVTSSPFNVINPDRSFFQPRGTDTVPAMLSEGEFVINARSAQKHRGVLEHINAGKSLENYQPTYRQKGGVVGYLAGGGLTTGSTPMIDWSEPLDRMGRVFNRALDGFNDFGSRFAQSAGTLTDAMNNLAQLKIPDTIELQARHDINVTLNGAEILNSLIPQIQNMVINSVNQQLSRRPGVNQFGNQSSTLT